MVCSYEPAAMPLSEPALDYNDTITMVPIELCHGPSAD